MNIHLHIDVTKWIKGWRLDKFFKSFKDNADVFAISITQAIKTAAEGTVAQVITSFIDEAFKTHVAESGLELIKEASFRLLAVELSIKGLPDNPTEADILEFNKEVWKAITGRDPFGKSKLYTTFATQMFFFVEGEINAGKDVGTFAEAALIIQTAYKKYKQDLADADATEATQS